MQPWFVVIFASLGKMISVCTVLAASYLIAALPFVIPQLQLHQGCVIKLIENVMPVSSNQRTKNGIISYIRIMHLALRFF